MNYCKLKLVAYQTVISQSNFQTSGRFFLKTTTSISAREVPGHQYVHNTMESNQRWDCHLKASQITLH